MITADRRAPAALARRLVREERGLTIVEGAVAALLLIVGALAVLQVFDASARNAYRAEESQVVVNRLQAELEEVQAKAGEDYDRIALSSAPATSSDRNDPRWRVSGTNYLTGASGTNPQPLVIDPTGAINPQPEPFQTGDVSGEIFKFVTRSPDCTEVLCPADETYLKRVIVAAKIDEAPVSFERAFQEVHTDIVDPDVEATDNPLPEGDEEENNVAQFWITDTPCNQAERQPIVSDHLAHNTRARCVDGHQTESTRGAPDLMFTKAPALDPNYPSDGQPLYDYATDPGAEPQQNADQDKGLLMPWASTDSCALDSVIGVANLRKLLDDLLEPLLLAPGPLDGVLDLLGGDSEKHLRLHTWLSPTVASSGGVLTGEGTLELWTKTVNGASHPGEICVSLFIRQKVQVPVKLLGVPLFYVEIEADLPVVNTASPLQPTFFTHSEPAWPTDWTEVEMPLEFIGVDSTGAPIPLTLTPGSQIGMTLMVKKGGTEPGNALEFMYDHASFESRLALETDQIIAFN